MCVRVRESVCVCVCVCVIAFVCIMCVCMGVCVCKCVLFYMCLYMREYVRVCVFVWQYNIVCQQKSLPRDGEQRLTLIIFVSKMQPFAISNISIVEKQRVFLCEYVCLCV